jgi:hypothetical protein
LKQLEERHVQAVRGLEKLAKALEHARLAREELNELDDDQNLMPPLAVVPEQLKAVGDALEAETWRIRADITDVELDQTYLRSCLPGHGEDPTAS